MALKVLRGAPAPASLHRREISSLYSGGAKSTPEVEVYRGSVLVPLRNSRQVPIGGPVYSHVGVSSMETLPTGGENGRTLDSVWPRSAGLRLSSICLSGMIC